METALALPKAETEEQKTALQEYVGLAEWKEVWDAVRRGKEIIVTDAVQVDLIAEARKVRLELKRGRTAIEAKRLDLKKDLTLRSKAIDGMANVLKEIIIPVEQHLEAQEKFAEVQEEKRLNDLKVAREAELGKYLADVSFYDLKSMSEQGFQQLLDYSRIAYENRIAAEKKAEADRTAKEEADAAERERVIAENDRLKAKNAEAEAKLKKEQEAKEKAEAETKRLQDEQDRKDRAERERKEAQAKADKLAADRARRAPDKVKLETFAAALSAIPAPEAKSEEAQAIVGEAIKKLSAVVTFIKQSAAKL